MARTTRTIPGNCLGDYTLTVNGAEATLTMPHATLAVLLSNALVAAGKAMDKYQAEGNEVLHASELERWENYRRLLSALDEMPAQSPTPAQRKARTAVAERRFEEFRQSQRAAKATCPECGAPEDGCCAAFCDASLARIVNR